MANPGALERSLGPRQAVAMVVGTIIGGSIFVQHSEITRQMPSLGGVLLAWLGAGVLTLCGALTCAELASAFPATGRVYVFLQKAWSSHRSLALLRRRLGLRRPARPPPLPRHD